MIVVETQRLILRQLALTDAAFILQLVNEPAWLEFIGDKGVRTLADAREYLRKGPLDMYERHGFGLWRVELKAQAEPIGICGLIKRDTLPEVDIGFALLPAFWGQGYAGEAALGVLDLAQHTLGLKRVLAITSPHNEASMKLLRKIGFQSQGLISDPGGEQLHLFALNF